MFISSNDKSNPANFNHKSWNKQVCRYCGIIESKFQPSSMDDIVLKVCPFMKQSTTLAMFITVLTIAVKFNTSEKKIHLIPTYSLLTPKIRGIRCCKME